MVPSMSDLPPLRRWAVLDFETATGYADSACAIGVIYVDDGEVVGHAETLIRPPGNRYDPMNIAIHGITPDRTKHAPSYAEIWRDLAPSLSGRALLAHNAGFDMGVIRQSAMSHRVALEAYEFACTIVLARKAWPGLESYRLDAVSHHLGVRLDHHHDALADAAAASEIALLAGHHVGSFDLREICEQLEVHVGQFSTSHYHSCAYKRREVAVSIARLSPASEVFDEAHPLFNKTVVFTGTLENMTRKVAAQAVIDAGGAVLSNVDRDVDYVVGGIQRKTSGTSSKLHKAAELVAHGFGLTILSEREFLELVAI